MTITVQDVFVELKRRGAKPPFQCYINDARNDGVFIGEARSFCTKISETDNLMPRPICYGKQMDTITAIEMVKRLNAEWESYWLLNMNLWQAAVKLIAELRHDGVASRDQMIVLRDLINHELGEERPSRAELIAAIRWVVNQRADDICWLDVYAHLGTLVGGSWSVADAAMLPMSTMIGNCVRFCESLRNYDVSTYETDYATAKIKELESQKKKS